MNWIGKSKTPFNQRPIIALSTLIGKVCVCISVAVVISQCASVSLSPCVKIAGGASTAPPCWLATAPSEGVVVRGDRGVRKHSETKRALLADAIVEFAARKYGVDVKLDAVIEQETIVREQGGTETISKRTQQQLTAEVSAATERIPIKAEIKDYYYDPRTERMWVWAVEVE